MILIKLLHRRNLVVAHHKVNQMKQKMISDLSHIIVTYLKQIICHAVLLMSKITKYQERNINAFSLFKIVSIWAIN